MYQAPPAARPTSLIVTPFTLEGFGTHLGFTVRPNTAAIWNNTSGTATLYPIWLQAPTLLSAFVTWNSSSTIGGFDLGVYDAQLVRVSNTGSMGITSPNCFQVMSTAPVYMPAGQYYIALASQSNSLNICGTNPGDPVRPQGWLVCHSTGGTLPPTITASADPISWIPVMGMVGFATSSFGG